MKKPVLIILLAVSMVFLAWGVSFAQGVSVELKGGTFMPSGDLNKDNWEDGFYGELAATYRESSMGVQAGLGYYTTEYSDTFNDFFLGKISEDDSLTVIPLTASFLGFYDNGPLHIYGGGGIGYYFAEIEGDINFKDLGIKWDDSDKDSVFGYHALAGLEYDVTSRFYIGAEGRIMKTNEAQFEMKDKGLKATYKSELGGNVIAAKIGFRF